MESCLFDQWYNGENPNINNFTKQLFETFLVADGINRNKIRISWPELFENLQSF